MVFSKIILLWIPIFPTTEYLKEHCWIKTLKNHPKQRNLLVHVLPSQWLFWSWYSIIVKWIKGDSYYTTWQKVVSVLTEVQIKLYENSEKGENSAGRNYIRFNESGNFWRTGAFEDKRRAAEQKVNGKEPGSISRLKVITLALFDTLNKATFQ